MTINREIAKDIGVLFILVLVGVACFGLGRLSVKEEGRVPLQVVSPELK